MDVGATRLRKSSTGRRKSRCFALLTESYLVCVGKENLCISVVHETSQFKNVSALTQAAAPLKGARVYESFVDCV